MLDDLSPSDSAMLILPGADTWLTGDANMPFAEKAGEFLDAGVPVAAICGATGGLAAAGLLDDRRHTSNAAEFLASTGYGGADLYVDEPAVTDGDLVTGQRHRARRVREGGPGQARPLRAGGAGRLVQALRPPRPGGLLRARGRHRTRSRGVTSQELLSGVALKVFRLNGQLLGVADELARPAGLTAAWWQVLGAVLPGPLSVSGIAREMGITRQSVQRIADLLVDRGLAEYLPNPAHRRAKLLRPTAAGYDAVRKIDPGHAALAGRLAEHLGIEDFERALDALTRLSEALDAVAPEENQSELVSRSPRR